MENMEQCVSQVMQKDLGRRLQVGQDIIDYILDRQRSQDLEQDQTLLDRMVDSIASTWVNSSNFKVRKCYLQTFNFFLLQSCFWVIVSNKDRATGCCCCSPVARGKT